MLQENEYLCTIEKALMTLKNENQKCLKVKANKYTFFVVKNKIKFRGSYPDLLCKIAGIRYST